MRLTSLCVYPDAVSHPPPFSGLPDSPTLEIELAADLRDTLEIEAAPLLALSDDEQDRIAARFPWGYRCGPQVTLDAGDAPFVGQVYGVGFEPVECGRFATHAEALTAAVTHARHLVAARLRQRRRDGNCPAAVRRRRCRQPWLSSSRGIAWMGRDSGRLETHLKAGSV